MQGHLPQHQYITSSKKPGIYKPYPDLPLKMKAGFEWL